MIERVSNKYATIVKRDDKRDHREGMEVWE